MGAAAAVNDVTLRLTLGDMRKIASLVYAKSGIALRPETKRAMVLARLQKRLRRGGFATVADYLDYLEQDTSGTEVTALLDAIATNHTSFFREPTHFQLLASHVVPSLNTRSAGRPIFGWSAACSTGEEAYSIAITLLDAVPISRHADIRLLASDLSTRALDQARKGVYALDRVSHLPQPTLHRYFERGLGAQEGLARVKRSVRQVVDFRRLNLVEINALGPSFDFIFCRNVMIYFDREARQHATAMLERHLLPNGFLFVSHVESLSEIDHRLRWCAPGVYQRGPA